MHRSLSVFLPLALLVFAASPVFAQGPYAGGGFGRTLFGTDVKGLVGQVRTIDEGATSWKVFGGAASRFAGIEGGYRDFGTVKTDFAGVNFQSGTTAWDVAGFARLRVPILDVFAKAGAMWWSRNSRLGSVTEDTKGTDFFWGVGLGLHFGPLGVRVEWERLEIGAPDTLSMVSVSGTIGF
jgi:hypothetical protein